eukprot:6257839-Lingulodinium_polyedra.AAC.1
MPGITSAASWQCGSDNCRAVNWPGRARCRLCSSYCPASALTHPGGAARGNSRPRGGRGRGGQHGQPVGAQPHPRPTATTA